MAVMRCLPSVGWRTGGFNLPVLCNAPLSSVSNLWKYIQYFAFANVPHILTVCRRFQWLWLIPQHMPQSAVLHGPLSLSLYPHLHWSSLAGLWLHWWLPVCIGWAGDVDWLWLVYRMHSCPQITLPNIQDLDNVTCMLYSLCYLLDILGGCTESYGYTPRLTMEVL